jgi:hypothetical protein
MATITYTATDRSGRTRTRTSGTMYYTHHSLARGSWHTSHAAAVKAGDPVPAVPTAVNGRVAIGDFADHPNAAAVAALIAAKHAAANAAAAPARQGARVKRGAPIKGKLGKAEPIRPRILLDPHNAAQPFEHAAPVSDGGPLGHLCACLSQLDNFQISHAPECPAAPPAPTTVLDAPPPLF